MDGLIEDAREQLAMCRPVSDARAATALMTECSGKRRHQQAFWATKISAYRCLRLQHLGL